MLGFLDWFRPRWAVFTLLVSGALLAGAHAFENLGGLLPCALCLAQRERHWLIVGLAAAALIGGIFLKSERYQRIVAIVLGLALAWSVYEAAHHVAVEQRWVVATCHAEVDIDAIAPLDDFEGVVEEPACDEIAWTLFGISMAGYNSIISLVMMLASFAIGLAPRWKQREAA